MRRKLPALKSLLAFEAVARHLSISRAADELCVTPAAISHHIRSLEMWLGMPVLQHGQRNVTLTDAGRAYARDLSPLFDGLNDATNALISCKHKDKLTITAPPSFTTKWLLPRLHVFRELHQDIDIALSVSAALVDCAHERTDVGIHYGRGGYSDLDATHLLQVELFPVCRPTALLDGRSPPTNVEELAEHTLLHDDMLRINERKDWRYWLQSAGARNVEIAERGLHFNQAALAYQAAIDGHGIALAKNVLVNLDLRAGSLVRPFDHVCETDHHYWLVSRPSKSKSRKVMAFHNWMLEEIADRDSPLPSRSSRAGYQAARWGTA